MFSKLTDFSYRRNWKEAIGFYIAYALLGALIGALAGGVMAAVVVSPVTNDTFSTGFAAGARVGERAGVVVAVIISLALSLVFITKKKLGFGYWFVGLLAGVLALFGGAILGLLPVAYLSTVASRQNS